MTPPHVSRCRKRREGRDQAPRGSASNPASAALAHSESKNRQVDVCIEVTFDTWGNGSNIDARDICIVDSAGLPPL